MLRVGKLLAEIPVNGLLHWYEKGIFLVTDTMRPIKLIPFQSNEYNYIINEYKCRGCIEEILQQRMETETKRANERRGGNQPNIE